MIKYYAVELHTHSRASDGIFTYSELVDKVIQSNVSAFAITDHNTDSGYDETLKYAEQKGIVLIKGVEWTTFYGHIVVSGGHNNIDWTEIDIDNIDYKLKQAYQSGDIVTLAHPFRVGDPYCYGCHNDFRIKAYQYLTSYEVWSSYYPNIAVDNLKSLNQWSDLLYKNYKIAAVYGRDWHNNNKSDGVYGVTYVGVLGELSSDNIIKGIRAGRTYIATGLKMDVKVIHNDKEYSIGDTISLGDNKRLAIKITTDIFNKEYNSRIITRPKKLVLKGTLLNDKIECDIVNNCAIIENIDVSYGHIRVEIMGDIDKLEDVILAISSAIYLD